MCEKSMQNRVSETNGRWKERTNKNANSIARQVKNTPELFVLHALIRRKQKACGFFTPRKPNLGDRLPPPEDPGRCLGSEVQVKGEGSQVELCGVVGLDAD
jgi:hypothetical protein